MLNWGLWFVHVFISTLFIAGYLTIYGRYWAYIFRGNLRGRVQYVHRAGLALLPVIMALLLSFAGSSDPINTAMYINLMLFALLYPLLSDRISIYEYLFACACFAKFWLHFHIFSVLALSLSVAFLVFIFWVNWTWHHFTHYSWWANELMVIAISGGFWLTQIDQPITIGWGALLTFLLMNSFAFIYWSTAHQNAVEQERLANRANNDALTNSKSYAKFRSDLHQEFVQAKQKHTPLTLVMLDIDDFKAINDRYGHAAGNAVLIGVAALLNEIVGSRLGLDHEIYRTGGEEFNLVLSRQTPTEALPLIMALHNGVREAHFDFEGKQLHVTISIGVTELTTADRNIDALYKRADASLYDSKRSGRDAVTIEDRVLKTNEHRSITMPYSFFTQPVVAMNTQQVVQNSFVVRRFAQELGKWVPTTDMDMTAEACIELLVRTTKQLTVTNITIPISWTQFTDSRFTRTLCAYGDAHAAGAVTLVIADAPDLALLHKQVAIYHAHQLRVQFALQNSCPDSQVVRAIIAATDECELGLVATRQKNGGTAIWPVVSAWAKLTQELGKRLILADVVTKEEARNARALQIEYLAGEYFE